MNRPARKPRAMLLSRDDEGSSTEASSNPRGNHGASEFNSSRPSSRRLQRSHHRGSLIQKSPSGRGAQYINHLESQLTEMQTQLLSLVSPPTAIAPSVRLRALEADNSMLRARLDEWQYKFAETLKDQMTHYEFAAVHMKTHLAVLERENSEKSELLREMNTALSLKTQSIEAAEAANRDLERRLEFMSSLVATSPGRLDLHAPPPSESHRKRMALDHSQRPAASLASPSRFALPPNALQRAQTIDSVMRCEPAPRRAPHYSTCTDSLVSSLIDTSTDSGYSTDFTNDMADSLSETASGPGRRHSATVTHCDDDADRCKPARRMRRFYAGSARQSLILPSRTDSSASQPTSGASAGKLADIGLNAPVPSHRTLSAGTSDYACSTAKALHVPLAHVGSPYVRRSPESASADDAAPSAVDQQQGFNALTADSDTSAELSGSVTRPFAIPRSLPKSIGGTQRRNLSNQLNRIKHECEHMRLISTDSTLTVTVPIHKTGICHNSLPALSDSSSLTEPADEPEIDLNHHNPLAAFPFELDSQTSVRVLRLPPVLRQVVTLLLHPQSLQLSFIQARHLMSYTWQNVTVSRPVLEFRLWLVRLLLGWLRNNHDIMSLHARQGHRDRIVGSAANLPACSAPASALGLRVAGSDIRRGSLAAGDPGGEADTKADDTPRPAKIIRTNAAAPGRRPLYLSLGHDYDDSDADSDGDPDTPSESHAASPAQSQRVQPSPCHLRSGSLATDASQISSECMDVDTRAWGAASGLQHRDPPAVGWLRFSATMVAAVGMALVHGPHSLLNGCRRCR